MKKILLTFMLFISLFVMVGCGSKEKNPPALSNAKELYLTATEGSYTYSITNQQMYDALKRQFGVNVLNDLVDRDILKATAKGNSNYWDSITESQIEESYNKEVYPSGKEGLTPEEIEKAEKAYLDTMFLNYGFKNVQDIYNFHHLVLAKNLYAEDQLKKQYDETDFTDAQYENYYNANYKKSFYTIFVAFESQKLLEDALKQLGYHIDNGIWTKSDNTAMTDQEIVRAFIALYNMNNVHKLENYPDETLTLKEDTHFSVVNGNIVFDLEEIPMLFFTNTQIVSYQSELATLLKDRLTTYPEGSWYTNTQKVYRNGSRYLLAMKIGESQEDFADVKADIKDALIKNLLTSTYINTEIIKLRAQNNYVFYDAFLENEYVKIVEARNLKHETTKKTSKTIVAKTDIKEYSADDLFAELNRNFGMMIATTKLEFARFINNPDLNKIYNLQTKEVLNESKWNVIKQQVTDEKQNFEKDLYKDYGYPASYGWKNFLRDIYGVDSEDELLEYYLFLEVKDSFSASLGNLSEATEESALWQFYLRNMNNMADRFFNVSGIHLLIHIVDNTGKPVNPENYTTYQSQLAKEFYEEVMVYLQNETVGTYNERLKAVVDAYNRAPRFLPGTKTTESQPDLPNVEYVFKGIELSKYKTAGLTIKFENLGQFRNDRMVKEFDDAVRSIWQANPDTSTATVYGLEPNNDGEWTYLVTEFGYHVYVNLNTYPIATWADDDVVPTLEQIKKYIADKTTKELTDKVKTAITTYYSPINTELIGANNFSLTSFKAIKSLNINLGNDDYSLEDFIKFIDLRIEKIEENIKYK